MVNVSSQFEVQSILLEHLLIGAWDTWLNWIHSESEEIGHIFSLLLLLFSLRLGP